MKAKIIFAGSLAIITTAIVSFTLVWTSVGFSSKFPLLWLKSWLIAYLVALPVVLFVGPVLQKFIQKKIIT